jgi:hypothetical protein
VAPPAGRRVPLWLTAVTAGVVVVGIAAAVALNLSPPPPAPAPPAVSAAQLTAYDAAITPALQSAGAMVEQDIKPSIAALEAGSLTAATIRDRAAGWRVAFAQARVLLARATVPAQLSEAAADFDRAFQQYQAAAATLGTLPDSATGGADPDGVRAAAAQARQADASYDSAATIIQRLRRSAGLAPSADLPDPTPSG